MHCITNSITRIRLGISHFDKYKLSKFGNAVFWVDFLFFQISYYALSKAFDSFQRYASRLHYFIEMSPEQQYQ